MNATAKMVHGLDGSLVDPDWPPLSLEEITALLDYYPQCGAALSILSTSPRPFSAASVVETTAGRIFVKRHHRSVRDRAGLKEEHAFMRHLRANGASVPLVLDAASGVSAVERGDWTYEVHEALTGSDIYGEALSWTAFRSEAHARSAGEMMASLHLAARDFNAAARRVQPLVSGFTLFASDDPDGEFDRYCAARPELAANAAVADGWHQAWRLLEPFHQALTPHLAQQESLWTHNDLHASNLLWSDLEDSAQAVLTIDFGLADRCNPVYDLAIALERNTVGWLELKADAGYSSRISVEIAHARALLNGYTSVRPLGDAESRALAPMTALCHAEFALTEAHYFLKSLHSSAKAQVAAIDYLAGHARWFCSRQGTEYLREIERCLEAQG